MKNRFGALFNRIFLSNDKNNWKNIAGQTVNLFTSQYIYQLKSNGMEFQEILLNAFNHQKELLEVPFHFTSAIL